MTLLLLAIFASSSAQEQQEIRCNFVEIEDDYYCLLFEIEVTDPNVNLTITGEHSANFTDDDVNSLQIQGSSTPFLIPEIFTTFRNLKNLFISFSMLETISRIPDTVQLHHILLIGNNISRIENNTFETQSELRNLEIVLSSVMQVEEDAFVGLESLQVFALVTNQVSELPSRVFHSLINVTAIDLRGNQIEQIQDQLFAENSNLEILLLESNQIRAISPRFVESMRDTLQTIHLFQNPCIDRGFEMESDAVWSFMTAALNECFDNWTGLGRDEPRVNRLRFGSRMRISDGFGNLVFSTNENSDENRGNKIMEII